MGKRYVVVVWYLPATRHWMLILLKIHEDSISRIWLEYGSLMVEDSSPRGYFWDWSCALEE